MILGLICCTLLFLLKERIDCVSGNYGNDSIKSLTDREAMKDSEMKKFIRYTKAGRPRFENEKGERICSFKDCETKSFNHWLCYKHNKDKSKHNKYLKSIQKEFLNEYELINDEYYELSVDNSEFIYKIDKEDYSFASKYLWRTFKKEGLPYLIRSGFKRNSETYTTYWFHAEILKEDVLNFKKNNNEKKIVVDHKSGDVTDNRRNNLRICSQRENSVNIKVPSTNTSGVIGVTWHNRDNIWESFITSHGEEIYLGRYYYLRNAVKARIEAENVYHKEFAPSLREKYGEYVDSILKLPHKIEPLIRDRPDNEFGLIGVRRRKDRNPVKYVGEFWLPGENRSITKNFNTSKEAIEWRKEKEIEYYGVEILYKDAMKYQQI